MVKRVARVYRETIPDEVLETPQENLNIVVEEPIQVIPPILPKFLHKIDTELTNIIQNSGSFEKEFSSIKELLRREATLAFNQGCVNGNGAARGAHTGEVYNIYEYLALQGL